MLNNETIYELTQGIEFMGYEHMIFYCENVIKTKSEGILLYARDFSNHKNQYWQFIWFSIKLSKVRRVRAKVANRIYSQIMSIVNKSIQWFLPEWYIVGRYDNWYWRQIYTLGTILNAVCKISDRGD